MFTRSILTTTTLLLASVLAQQSATPAQSSSVASATSSASAAGSRNWQADTQNLVNYLVPSAPSSLSPAQVSNVAHDASNFLSQYTQTNPIATLEQNAIVNQGVAVLIGGTSPSPAQQSSIEDLLNQAGTAALANPSAYVQSVEELVRPFAFAGAVTSYADGLMNGLRTVIASELSVPVPTPSSRSSTGGVAQRAMPTGAVGVAAVAALGIAGMVVA